MARSTIERWKRGERPSIALCVIVTLALFALVPSLLHAPFAGAGRWSVVAIVAYGVASLMWVCMWFFGVRAWIRDRRERSGACRRCGYDLAGLDVCPECGERRADGVPG